MGMENPRIPFVLDLPASPHDAGRGCDEQCKTLDELLKFCQELHTKLQGSHQTIADESDNIFMAGTTAQRPTAIGSRRFYYDTDLDLFYADIEVAGSPSWEKIGPATHTDYCLVRLATSRTSTTATELQIAWTTEVKDNAGLWDSSDPDEFHLTAGVWRCNMGIVTKDENYAGGPYETSIYLETDGGADIMGAKAIVQFPDFNTVRTAIVTFDFPMQSADHVRTCFKQSCGGDVDLLGDATEAEHTQCWASFQKVETL